MLESKVENYLIRRVNEAGGLTAKMTIMGRRGWPDRLVCLPGALVALVELKRPRKAVLSPHQVMLREKLAGMNIEVHVLWSIEDVDKFIDQALEHVAQRH